MSCDEDKEMCKKAHLQTVYTAELLLTGILRQQLDLEQYVISCEQIMYSGLGVVYMTSSTQDWGWDAFGVFK